MSLSCLAAVERSQIATFASLRIFLSRVQPVFSGFQFTYHAPAPFSALDVEFQIEARLDSVDGVRPTDDLGNFLILTPRATYLRD